MIDTLQTRLPLQLHQRTALVTVETARSVKGVDTDSLLALIDSGELRWAWDISVGGQGLREIRIWARELISPAPDFAVDDVIDAVIGTDRSRLRSTELSTHLLICSRPHVMRLLRGGELSGSAVGHTEWVDRSSLVGFFRRRLLSVSVTR